METLPEEIVAHIVTFLPVSAMTIVPRTSEAFRQACTSELLWQQLYVRDIGVDNAPQDGSTWREMYKTGTLCSENR
jgi:hypothetical protein